jgi:4-amino-4-deoxychorismate lyase
MEQFWINGVPGRLIDITDRGLTYGDGIFETMAIRRYTLRFLDLHLDRLYAGAARLGLSAPERYKLHAQLTAAAAGIDEGVMKLILTRGPGPRGYAPPQRQEPTVAWGLHRQAAQPVDADPGALVCDHRRTQSGYCRAQDAVPTRAGTCPRRVAGCIDCRGSDVR